MKRFPSDAAKRISKILVSASSRSRPTESWTPSLEQKLHQLGFRDSLNPSLVARVIDPYLLNHHSLALGFFNWASQQPGFIQTSLTYHSLLKSLSISRQFNTVDKLLKQARTQKIVLDSSVYNSVIASQIIGKKTHNAFCNFNEVLQLGLEIRPGICDSLLAALASDGYLDDARRVFEEMHKRGVPMSTVGFGVFIGRFCRVAELGKTLELLDEVKRGASVINGSVVAVLVVDGLCRVSRVSEASIALEELRIRDCKPDFIAYRIVAEGFRLACQELEAEKVLKRKRKLGVAPRADDYREFLFALISERWIWQAKELGEAIVDGNFPIEDDVLNALIGSVSAIDPDAAISFCRYMIEKGRSPTLLTLSNLGRNLYKNGKIDEMSCIFEALSSKDYFSDLESYNLMVSFFCKAGRVKQAYRVLQEMKKKGFGPDVSSYNSLMEACCREDLLRPAKRLYDEMFASGCYGNLKTYNILIQKLSKSGEADDANHLFLHMLEKGLVPDATTYSSLLEGLCLEAKIQAACEIFNKCIQQDISLAKTMLTTFVSALCKEGHFAAASRAICGITPDSENASCHVLLLRSLVEAGEVRTAMEHVKWIRDTSPSISQVISTELVASLSSSLKPGPIIQLLGMMKENGLVFDNDTWMELCKESPFIGC